MSAVLCLPACLCVSAAASKAFHRRGVTHPSRATRGRLSPEQHRLRSATRSIAPSVSNSAESVKEV